jgi:hypothetical protein
LTTNQAVEGSNPSSVTKSKQAQSLQRKLQAFFIPKTTRCLHQSGVGIKKESSAKRGQALRWFVRNSDKEGSFERSEKNPEVEQ